MRPPPSLALFLKDSGFFVKAPYPAPAQLKQGTDALDSLSPHTAAVESVPGNTPNEEVFRWVCSCGAVGRSRNATSWGAELGARSHLERTRRRTP